MTIGESLSGKLTRLMSLAPDAACSAAELRALQQQRREDYLRTARRAASDERGGHYATAAHAWETALGVAQGRDVDWCKCRLALCLRYARAPGRQGGASGSFLRERRTARAGNVT